MVPPSVDASSRKLARFAIAPDGNGDHTSAWVVTRSERRYAASGDRTASAATCRCGKNIGHVTAFSVPGGYTSRIRRQLTLKKSDLRIDPQAAAGNHNRGVILTTGGVYSPQFGDGGQRFLIQVLTASWFGSMMLLLAKFKLRWRGLGDQNALTCGHSIGHPVSKKPSLGEFQRAHGGGRRLILLYMSPAAEHARRDQPRAPSETRRPERAKLLRRSARRRSRLHSKIHSGPRRAPATHWK